MPSPKNDPNLTTQQQQLREERKTLEQQIDDAPEGEDTSAQDQRIDEINAQLKQLNTQQQDYRKQNRQQGQGRANAPGQQNR